MLHLIVHLIELDGAAVAHFVVETSSVTVIFLGLGFSPIPLSVESIPQHWKLWVGSKLPVWGVKHFKGLFVILRHENCPDGERSFFQLFSLILERLESKASSWVLPQKVKVNRESQNWGNLKFVYFFISFNEGLENQAKIVWWRPLVLDLAWGTILKAAWRDKREFDHFQGDPPRIGHLGKSHNFQKEKQAFLQGLLLVCLSRRAIGARHRR